MTSEEDAFEVFRNKSPQRKEPALQALFDYEAHYMKLVSRYRKEIEFINRLHRDYISEVEQFYKTDLPSIIEKLTAEPIDDDVRRVWISHMEEHIHASFEMSRDFIDKLTTKKVEEFDQAIRERMQERL